MLEVQVFDDFTVPNLSFDFWQKNVSFNWILVIIQSFKVDSGSHVNSVFVLQKII